MAPRLTRLVRLVRARPSTLDPLHTTDRPDATFENAWRRAMKQRIVVVLALTGLWAIGIEARLVQLQVFEHDALSKQARRQQQLIIEPEALRGDILDRNGNILAYSVEADSIAADPSKIADATKTVAAVCGALGDCSAKERVDLTARLSGEGQFAYVRRSRAVSPAQVQRVAALKLPGIVLQQDTRRYYPRAELAAHVLGFVDLDGAGQAGVEYSYDKVVRGQDGLAFVQVDAKRQRLETRVERAPLPGATLELTLDLRLQYVAERELKAGILANHAQGGTAIIMDPQTGEILALASYPTFNPNVPLGRFTADEKRNRAVQDVYEPGSTFKMVTASAALEEGIVQPDELIDTNPGYITIGGRKPIHDTHPNGVLSFQDVIVKSSNVGAIKIGLKTGAERLTRYVHRFGFGEALAPDFAGASRGIWNPSNLGESGLASVSMGYQVSVTPLQMVTAASAVANGGQLMQPRVVRAVVRDGQRQEIPAKVLRRAISSTTAATLTTFMEGVVSSRGTAPAASLERYRVAGKTGTAAKLGDHGYSKTDYNASFVGFVPSRNPAFTILVVVDTPKAGTFYGGTVAAPIFRKIAEAALQIAGVPPSLNPMPPVLVSAESPAMPSRPDRPTSFIPALTPVGGLTLMPDLSGMSAREALRTLSSVGLSVRVVGDGFVTQQSPAAGQPIDLGGWGAIELSRGAGTAAAGTRR